MSEETKKIKIIADSACDLPGDMAQKYDITILPIGVIIDGKNYRDGIDINTPELLEKIKSCKEYPTTSALQLENVKEELRNTLNAGYQTVIMILLHKNSSGSFQVCNIAKRDLEEEFGHKLDIHVIDGEGYSVYNAMLVNRAAVMIEQGYSEEKILEKIEYIKAHRDGIFVISNLEALKKSGRIKPGVAILGGLMNIKPIVTIQDGRVVQIGKERGMAKAIHGMILSIEKKLDGQQMKEAWIAETNAGSSIDSLVSQIKEKFNPEEIFICSCRATLALHAGDGFLGVSYNW
jgi:DegV family protein with EDD domain